MDGIVDLDSRSVDLCLLGQGAEASDRFGPGSTLAWTPGPDSETLEIDVDEIFEGLKELPGG